MFNRLRGPAELSGSKVVAKPSQAPPVKVVPPEARPFPGLNESPERRRRREVINALLLTDKEQERVALQEEIAKLDAEMPSRLSGPTADMGRVLEGMVLEARTPGTPGIVSVRVTGAGANERRIPLEGLRVRATLGDKSAEGLTDATGLAFVFLGEPGSFEVEVPSGAGEALQRAKELLSPGKSVSLDVSVTESPELSERFARGRAFLDAVRQRAERIPSLQSGDNRALEQRIAMLEATGARLEQTLAQLTRGDTKESKGAKETKGRAE